MINKLRLLLHKLLNMTTLWKDHHLLIQQIKPLRSIVILAIAFSVLASTFEGLSVGFLLTFLQNLTNPHAEPIRTGIQFIDINLFGIYASSKERLYRISGLILLSTILRSGFNYLNSVFSELVALKWIDRLRRQIFEQLQAVQLNYFANTQSGDLVNSITTELAVIKYIFGSVSFLLTRVLSILAYSLTMFLLSWQLTTTTIFLLMTAYIVISKLNSYSREASFDITLANSRLTSTNIEFINGIRTIHAFASQEFERQKFYLCSNNWLKASTKSLLSMSLVKPLSEIASTSILIGIIVWTFTFETGTIQVASLLTFFFVLFRMVPITQDINGTCAYLSSLRGSAENIQKLLRTDNKPYFCNGKIEFLGLKHSIDLECVDFAYIPNRLVLKNITLSIERGRMTAFVGSSGAGKSTLADLIPRFYDPTGGCVLIDGIDLKLLEINSLRQKMAIVSQDTFIFNASIRDNITYGTQNVTDKEIWEAVRLANALDFIQEMPEKLNAQLGDRGVKLSGGQRQRIAIARALLRKPEIIILDEATSALDSVSERIIQEAIENLAVGRTVIAIAHRLSTISSADKVVVLENGIIVEQGTYEELLTQRGKLWQYHDMQHKLSHTTNFK